MVKGFRIPGSQEAHDTAELRLMGKIQSRFSGRVFLLHQYVGLFNQRNGKKVYIGVKGIADIGGWLDGRAFQIEVKSGMAVRNKDQEAFGEMAVKTGAIYIVARFSGQWSQCDELEAERICCELESAAGSRLLGVPAEPVRKEPDPDQGR